MELFYTEQVKKPLMKLSSEESKHCIKVLRHKKGDIIYLTDGRGFLYEGIIVDPNPSSTIVEIKEVRDDFGKVPYFIEVAMPPLKIPSRYEWFIEKAVELGVSKIVPILTRYTEKSKIKSDRAEKLIIAAMKQSLRTVKPEFSKLVNFEDYINQVADYEQKIIAICEADTPLKEVYEANKKTVLIIGPEGGFSEYEKQIAINAGFKPVRIAYTRLRSETAAITALATMVNLNLT